MTPKDADQRLQAAIEQLISGDVAELIEAARAQAVEQVKAQLRDAMADAMLARARELLEPATRRDPAPRPARGASPPRPVQSDASPHRGAHATALYVYCVVRATVEIPSNLPGIDPAHRVTSVRHDRLAAVVSRVALEDFDDERLRERLADMEWLEHAARTHDGVLGVISGHATLIPMRLCSVYRTKDGVREMLNREAQALTEALDHVEGKREWGVKVFANPRASRAAENAAEGPPESGTQYMRRRQDERAQSGELDQELHEASVAIHERLSGLVADALTTTPQRPEVSGHPGQMLLNGVYLVEDEQRPPFLAMVQALQSEYSSLGLELHPTGPWPAYNFIPGTIGAAW
jgi:gas vesicle protein GvpL/GvpF